jgi:nitroreductase
MDATEAIRVRRSIRKFVAGAEIPEEHLKLMLEAAMMAPSAHNTRPWDFTVVKSLSKREAIAAIHPYGKMLPKASLAVVVGARPDLLPQGMGDFWPQDCAAAAENFLIQAAALGYGAVWCGVYPDMKRAEQVQNIVGGASTPFCVIAVGVPSEKPAARGYYDPERVRIL